MALTKILCPVDFSPGADRALQTAARLAAQTGAQLVVVHAWYIPPTAYSVEAPFPADVTERIIGDAQTRLDALREAQRGVEITTKLLCGVPWIQVVAELEQGPYDLCVIGTHGRTGLARVVLGSVATKVVRHAPCSVLVVRPDGEVKPFRHGLVPTDFSESAARAVDLAPQILEPGGRLSLLHVIEVPVDYAGVVPIGDALREIDKHASAALQAEASRVTAAHNLPVTTTARIGYPGAETLAAVTADPSIDLVVLGTHGRTGIRRILLGSVAEKVVRHARCEVLVARTRA
jgi:nucleotide-binding universal stress UspA family protein